MPRVHIGHRISSSTWRTICGTAALVCVISGTAEAQSAARTDAALVGLDVTVAAPGPSLEHLTRPVLLARVHDRLPQLAPVPQWSAATFDRGRERPAVLMPLYVSFAALQALDAHSTLRALDAGHVEANPVVAPFATEPGAMVGLKALSTAGTIYLSERLWRRHPGAAIAAMIAVNSVYAIIVARNYRQPR